MPLKPGETLEPEAFGAKNLPRWVRKKLLESGLGWCLHTRKLYCMEAMYSKYSSYDGIRREASYRNAKRRARTGGLPFDSGMMKAMMRGDLPHMFNGVPYRTPAASIEACKHWPSRYSLSVDRISPQRGYVRGNVRFLPFWVNSCLQRFADAKARRIAERLYGIRPLLISRTLIIGSGHLVRLKQMVRLKVVDALRIGIAVDPSFTVDHLIENDFFKDRCPYSGIPFRYTKNARGGGHFDSPSFDRIDPRGGYSVCNVQLVAMPVNALKNDMRCSELIELVHALDYMQTYEFYESHVPACVRC